METTFDVRVGAIKLVSAYVSNANTRINGDELQTLIRETFSTLSALQPSSPGFETKDASPTVLSKSDVRKSITATTLVSFEDGRPYKSLKRHLSSRGISPSEYRMKWGLPHDYPMVHPTYSAQRSALAKSIGLGAKGRRAHDTTGEPVEPAKARKSRKPRTSVGN